MAQFKDIKYTLQRSQRKTASIYIERDGKVSVLVPEELSNSQVEELLEGKRKWIYRNLAEWEDLNATRVQRDYVNGEGFMYLGRSYRLKLVDEQESPLLLKDGYFCLLSNNGSAPNADAAFKEFFREKGKNRIPQRVAYYQDRMGVKANVVKIMELKNRWASCTSDGNINFHWKCMMAPPSVLDYIVVHELAHLIQPNHTQTFWNEVDKVMPDYATRKEWLRTNGAGMDL
ncbi:MAG: metal-dependent hydrolase [Gimesia sp.]|mgnify:FL=1|uniref:M48 family metallopeptidase n=1 Tax=Gimesia sp. TaxID=2024833 RepID=UPI000C6AF5D8|nr:SprT family zinc-dependent metalloprotease [Gimesia sp.]MAX35783.1 metal-dependent hydrolase [Gimesia sp.]|tara:strand:+ start:12968 stop:13657 length:690 start_codon:yes stop_codon:yes gene_type:complete